MTYKSINFTKKGERSHLTFAGEPQEDGSFILQVRYSESGTDAPVGTLLPKSDKDDYFPIMGFTFHQKESVVCLRTACEKIIEWFEKQEKEEPNAES